MAEQTVKVEGDSGSPAAVAYKLWLTVRHKHGTPKTMADDLGLFEQCLNAANGYKVDTSGLT